MIDREHALPITRQAQWLSISRSAVVCLPRPTRPAELDLMRRIDELHLEYPFMRARRLRRRHIATMARGFVSLKAVVHRLVQRRPSAFQLGRGHARRALLRAAADPHGNGGIS